VIEPGDGIWHEAKEPRSGVAVATSRGRDAGIVAKTEPGEASVQVISAVITGDDIGGSSVSCRSLGRAGASLDDARGLGGSRVGGDTGQGDGGSD
jgi:hypothetical protein